MAEGGCGDAGSRVDHTVLAPRAEPTRLPSGATLRVGSVELRYYDVGAFWDGFNAAE